MKNSFGFGKKNLYLGLAFLVVVGLLSLFVFSGARDGFYAPPPSQMGGMPAMSPNQVGALSPNQVGALPPTAMTGFNATQMSAMPPTAMAVAAMNPAAMAGMKPK